MPAHLVMAVEEALSSQHFGQRTGSGAVDGGEGSEEGVGGKGDQEVTDGEGSAHDQDAPKKFTAVCSASPKPSPAPPTPKLGNPSKG